MGMWFRKPVPQPQPVHRCVAESRHAMLVDMTIRNLLTPTFLWLCPKGQHAISFSSIVNVPDEIDCRCGVTHSVQIADIDVQFAPSEAPAHD